MRNFFVYYESQFLSAVGKKSRKVFKNGQWQLKNFYYPQNFVASAVLLKWRKTESTVRAICCDIERSSFGLLAQMTAKVC